MDHHTAGSGKRDNAEPIAVVGFSLKFPGEASSADGFWNMLVHGRNAMREFPSDRINLKGHYHPEKGRLDEMPVRGGHFIEDKIVHFDAPFFSITPAEASCMEPQQRGILETAYRALENAGITIDECSNTRTSVHTGSFTDDYRSVLFQDPLDGHTYAASGLSSSMLANRVSWFFNLKGPSINLDTACSSSMTCLHLSCEDLRNGTTNMGIVGGCNLFYHPDYMKIMSNMGFLSPDSRSWSLDEKANGYARGEGFGMMVVKRLSDAIKDGNTIRAVIRSTALNQDGRTPGITVPSGIAHRTLIQEAYAKYNIDMEPTRFFEAHATGTQAGDPIEANAIGETFCAVRSAADPLWIGAVKSNVGHLEAGSGMASVLKSILMLEKGVIPPNAGFNKLNKRIHAERYHIKIPTEARPWPTHGLRRICVNSFGFGGSNAVVILDDAYHYLKSRDLPGHHATRIDPPTESELKGHDKTDHVNGSRFALQSMPGLLVWSSVDEEGVKRMQAQLRSFFECHADDLHVEDIKNIIYTLNERRSKFTWRSFVAFSGLPDLYRKLGQTLPKARSSEGRNLSFIFTGQGAQYAGMGKSLMAFPVFQESLQVSQKLLTSMGCEWKLIDAMFAKGDIVNRPQYSQPLCTALQIALIDLLRTFNIRPSIVVGHSSGEIAAAYCIRSLSAASALKVAFHRGRLAAKLLNMTDRKISMMAAGISRAEAKAYLAKLGDYFETPDVDIACVNSSNNVTLSGDSHQLDYLEKALQADQQFARKLRVDIAYHSRFMWPIADEYRECLRHLSGPETSSELRPLMISSVTGDFIHPSELREPDYWVRNMTNPVNFFDAVSRLSAQSGKKRKVLGAKGRSSVRIADIVEIGPHHALRGPVRESLEAVGKGGAIQYHATLSRTSPSAVHDIMAMAGQLFSLGYAVDLLKANNLSARSRPLRVDLPEYSYQHSRSYWRESRIGRNYRLRDVPRHDFLGVKSSDWNQLQAQWRNMVGESRLPWLRDHKLAGNCLYPAGGMVAMAIEAARQLADPTKEISSYELREVCFLNAFRTLHRDDAVETRFSLSPLANKSSWSQFQLFIYEENSCIEICRGEIRTHTGDGSDAREHLQRWNTSNFLEKLNETKRSFTAKALYEQFATIYDAEYGPPFQTLDNISASATGQVVADLNTRKWAEAYGDRYVSSHIIHPTTVDGLFQLVFPASLDPSSTARKTLVPTRIQRLWVNAIGLASPENNVVRVMGDCSTRGYRGTDVRARVVSPYNNETLVEMEHYEATVVASSDTATEPASVERKLCAVMRWLPDVDFLSPAVLAKITAAPKASLPGRTTLPRFYQDLHLVIKYFLFNTLCRLNEASVQFAYTAHAHNLIRWMIYQLRDRTFGMEERERRMIQDEVFRSSLVIYTKNFNAEGKVLTTLAENLYNIIREEADPIQIIFEGTLASDYYHQLMATGTNVQRLTKYLDLIGHKNPGMKILEVGSGTGSCTEAVTLALTEQGRPRWSQYDYTDISPGFFLEAQKRFADYSHCMRFQVLDIAANHIEQGFEESSYDLIVAGNVLHALKDLRAALRKIRKLLRPNGKLVLFETTNPNTIRTGLYGGVLKDWWNGVKDEEKCSPLLSLDSWNNILRETGFSGLELVSKDFEDHDICEQSILVTSAASNIGSSLTQSVVALIADNGVAEQHAVARLLMDQLSSSGIVCKLLSIESMTPADIAGTTCISLLEVGKPFLATLGKAAFYNLKPLLENCKGILWVSQDTKAPASPEYGMINGFARVLRAEYHLQRLVTLALEPQEGQTLEECGRTIVNVLDRMMSTENRETEFEYSQRDGLLNINRTIHSNSMNDVVSARSKKRQVMKARLGDAPPLELRVESPGWLDSVKFYQADEAGEPLADDEVLVRVRAFGLAPRDYQIASGQLNEKDLGLQCSGLVEAAGKTSGFLAGDSVYLVKPSAFQTLMRCEAGNLARTPDGMSCTDAASLPAATMLAVHSLMYMAHLESNETVLVQDAATTAGQVMVQVAQALAARVFVTVRNEEQRKLLRAIYRIPEADIFTRFDLPTAVALLDATEGQGIDVIVASVGGEESEVLWRCLSSLGRFVNVSGKELDQPRSWRGNANTSYSSVSFADLVRGQPNHAQKLLERAHAMIINQQARPVAGIQVFGAGDVEAALEFFRDGEECGNSVIELSDESTPEMTIATQPLYNFDGDSTYVISGGLGGLGRSTARWMVDRGARNLLLLSRRGSSNPHALKLIAELEARGVRVQVPSCDIADLEQLQGVIDGAQRTMPPIRGCVQSAMLLRDAVFENMTYEDWVESTHVKVQGSWNLHLALPKGLDFFLFLSSVSAIIGGISQSNYAAGNAYMDALCHYRNATGECASVVNFGMLVADGVVVETEGLLESLRAMGQMMEISQEEMLALMEHHCQAQPRPRSPEECQTLCGIEVPSAMIRRGQELPNFLTRPLFRHFHYVDATNSGASSAAGSDLVDYASAISKAGSTDEVAAEMSKWLVVRISRVLGLTENDIDASKPISAYGVDSLLGMELRNWFERVLGAKMPIFELLSNSSMAEVCHRAASRTKFR